MCCHHVFSSCVWIQAKVAGTEQGVKEPTATFSACFGLPFMPLQPTVYAKLLREKLIKHNTSVWLLNTGWTGGKYGVGKRFSIKLTRQLLNAALDGKLDAVDYNVHPIFNLHMPTSCEGVDAAVFDPTWADKAAYEIQAKDLAKRCNKAFEPFEKNVEADVLELRPQA
jgi:phosphoenolpyruvate carboxykinase (ATP)